MLVPVVLICGLVASATRGGAGVSFGASLFRVTRVEEVPFRWGSDKPVFVLVVGSDARAGQDGSRGDALHVVGVNPGTGQATILNIPRDTWVPIGDRGDDKINVGHLYGGPTLQAQVVGDFVGVEIPYVISTGFDGFQAMVDELGGVTVDVPVAMNDDNSGAHFDPGPTHMDGGAALAFSRNRSVPGGDFGRTHDQSLVIIAALAKLRSESPTPAKVRTWLSILLRHGTFDGADAGDLYRLGQLALSIDPANVRTVTMPGSLGYTRLQSIVRPSAEADGLFADFRDDAVLQDH